MSWKIKHYLTNEDCEGAYYEVCFLNAEYGLNKNDYLWFIWSVHSTFHAYVNQVNIISLVTSSMFIYILSQFVHMLLCLYVLLPL